MAPLIATLDAARIIGVTTDMVRWWTRAGRSKAAVRLPSGQRLDLRAEVPGWAYIARTLTAALRGTLKGMPQGSLALYRRHLRTCKNANKGNRWTRCQCPIWVQGSIGGETIRRSLNTGNWTAASSIVHQW